MRKDIEFYFEETRSKEYIKWRGKDILKAKIKYIINKYYYNKPIYITYFKKYGKYARIRNILEELVKEGFLIKFKKVRPVYYLKKNFIFISAEKYKKLKEAEYL